MTTIKVVTESQALANLERVLGIPLPDLRPRALSLAFSGPVYALAVLGVQSYACARRPGSPTR